MNNQEVANTKNLRLRVDYDPSDETLVLSSARSPVDPGTHVIGYHRSQGGALAANRLLLSDRAAVLCGTEVMRERFEALRNHPKVITASLACDLVNFLRDAN